MGMDVSYNTRGKRALKSEINVTPLVDVMLVLLVIFMVTSPMLVSGVHVDLPKSTASPIGGQDEPIAVTIDAKRKIYIQNMEVELSKLGPKLAAVVKQKYDTRIFVRGDKNVSYGDVMRLFGTLQEAGFNNVALITEVSQGR